jgi:3(or 17)beta-hydroxysteroid dehydrogenase
VKRLDGKIAMVTGGASGIGEATCRLFATEGATVVIADINAPQGRELAREIAGSGGAAEFVETNVADEASFGTAVDTVLDRHGALDVLVNNAGIGGGSVSDDPATWWRLLRIDLLGTAWGTRHAVRAMRAGPGGVIVNVGSHSELRGCRTGLYGAAKAGVHALTRYTSLVHGPDRIRANTVLPGNVYTPIHYRELQRAVVRYVDGDTEAFGGITAAGLNAAGLNAEADRQEVLADFLRRHPMGRLATVGDIAHAALYLASDEAPVVTGNEFMVTGGILERRLSDRLARAGATASWPPVPAPPAGALALLTGNTDLAGALRARLAADGMKVCEPDAATRQDELRLSQWLAERAPFAGIVVAMDPDPGGDLGSQGPAEWQAVLFAGLRLPWVVANSAPGLVLPGGSLTFVTDAAGLTSAQGSPAFCAAAAGLTYLTDDFADQLRRDSIRVNTITAELTSAPSKPAGLGAPAVAADVAELVVTVSRQLSAVTGLQLTMETSHP